MIFLQKWILALIPLYFLLVYVFRGRKPSFVFPTGETVSSLSGGLKPLLVRGLWILRALAAVFLICALARPQIIKESVLKKEGVGIAIAIDCSSTMVVDDVKLSFEDLAGQDLRSGKRTISRIDAAKKVTGELIDSRENDLMGLVAFAAQAYVVSPPTFDHEWLKKSLNRIKVGIIRDGTAIGSGILTAMNSLKETGAKSKIVILVTDGINNFGRISPQVAAKAARALGIKVYTIGLIGQGDGLVDSGGGSGRKVYREAAIEVDEDQLEEIAVMTGGKYFRAETLDALKDSYKEIDSLERTAIEQKGLGEYTDVFQIFLWPALILLLLEIVLRNTFLRSLP